MDENGARTAVAQVLRRIAPEVDAGEVVPGRSLRTQLDLDSMDFLRFVTGLSETTGVELTEDDYADLDTLDGCVALVVGRSGPAAAQRGA